jgi:hypothetical protein
MRPPRATTLEQSQGTGSDRSVDVRPLVALVIVACRAALPTFRFLWRHRRYHGPAAGVCWPTMAGIGAGIGKAASTVNEHVRMLELAGLVTLLVAGGQDRPNIYLMRGYDRPTDEALAAELAVAWGLDPADAPAILADRLDVTAHRTVRRKHRPSDRHRRTVDQRVERRHEKARRAATTRPLTPRKSAQGRPRKSACNPATRGHLSTRDAKAPPRWVVSTASPPPPWTNEEKRRWRERTRTDQVVTTGMYGRFKPSRGFDRVGALRALRAAPDGAGTERKGRAP